MKIEMADNPDKKLYLAFVVKLKDEDADHLLVDFTTYEMMNRLEEQRNKGFSGWNTPQCSNADLIERLKKNLKKEDYIDVINLAAMLLARQRLFKEKPNG